MSNSTAIASTEETARFAPARLPWHPMIEERFGAIGANKASWKALTEAVFPGAKSVDSVVMALSYCAARKLDPFKRPVHIVPMWDSQSRQMVETVWPGISEIRTTAFRTGQYAGCDEVEFGPMVERTFTGMVGKRGQEKEVTIKVTFPEWGRINVYRTLNGHRCKFVSPKVYWLESYGRQGASDVPNDMWSKRPSGQLEKCVEAAGLRKAFPEEVGNDYTAEEMHGQALLSDATPHAQIEGPAAPVPQAAVNGPAAPPSPATHALGKPGSDFGQSDPVGRDHPVQDAEIVEPPSPAEGGGQPEPTPSSDPERGAEVEHPPHAQEEAFDVEAWLEEAQGLFHGAKTISDVDDVHAIFEETATDLPTIERQRYEDMHSAAIQRIEDQAQQEQSAAQDAENTGKTEAAHQSLPVDASEAQDDDVTLEADDEEGAETDLQGGDLYVARIRALIADKDLAFAVVGKLWNDTKAERQELMNAGLLSKEVRNELLAELDERKKAQAPGEQQGGPSAPPPASSGPGAPPPPANDQADEDPITKLDREFRAQLEACADKVAVAALAAETLVARNKFSGTPQHKAWSDLVAAKRKSFAGVA